MPELPEVQTVINSLLKKIVHKRILSYQELWHKVNYSKNTAKLLNDINTYNPLIKKINRLGKYIIIVLSNNYIIFHLRMTGSLFYSKNPPKNSKHLRCYFKLDNNGYLIYEDIRKFGGFYYYRNIDRLHAKIGIDPINNNNFNLPWLENNVKNYSRMIKALLLDQSFICGLGNIYIDEILWSSKTHPLTLSCALSNKQIRLIYNNIKKILNHSIKFHGTTIINFKFDNMKTGNYKSQLNVYGRENLHCNNCNKNIVKIKVSGRGTYICPHCQRQ